MPDRYPLLTQRTSPFGRLLMAMAIVGAVMVVGVVVLFATCSGGGGKKDDSGGPSTGQQATGTPAESVSVEQALTQYVTDQLGKEYAGDCTSSIVPESEGKLCSAAKGERGGSQKAFLLGPSSYKYDLWIFLSKQGDAWKVDGTQPVKPETANIPGAPWPLAKGAKVLVVGTGTCLNVRGAPGVKEQAVDCIADGTEITLEEGPEEKDGFQWWRPAGRSGWVAGDWLRYPEGIATPAPSAAASATPTPQ